MTLQKCLKQTHINEIHVKINLSPVAKITFSFLRLYSFEDNPL